MLNLLRRLQPEFWTNRDDWRLLFLSRLYPIRGVYENDAKESDDLTTKSHQKNIPNEAQPRTFDHWIGRGQVSLLSCYCMSNLREVCLLLSKFASVFLEFAFLSD